MLRVRGLKSRLALRLTAFRRDQILRSTGVLVGGTVGAQALGFLALPVLTRFYSPDDFSILAIYVAILTLAGAVTCMRLDVAIPLPKDDKDAVNLMFLALTSATIVTSVAAVIVGFTGPYLAQATGRPEIEPYLWLVPFGIGLAGTYSVFQYMAMRQKAFSLIARTKLTQAAVGLSSQLGLGWFGMAPFGLLLGHALMAGAGVVALALRTLVSSAFESNGVSRQGLWQTLRTYRRFPQYSVAEELTNNAGIQLPIILIAAMIVGPEAGLLFLAMRAVGTPMTIIGSAVAQVYYAHAAEYDRAGTLAKETTAVFTRLSRMLVIPMIFVGPFAPDVFRIAFGPDWARAGDIVIVMLPWYAFRLISSPISMVMHVRMRQGTMLALTTMGLFLRVAPLLVVAKIEPSYATLSYAISSAVFYAAIVLVFLRVAGLSSMSVTRLMGREVGLWAAVAMVSFLVHEVIFNA